jgi:lipoprotein-anchoring transpeptidase ErfK/SrfK
MTGLARWQRQVVAGTIPWKGFAIAILTSLTAPLFIVPQQAIAQVSPALTGTEPPQALSSAAPASGETTQSQPLSLLLSLSERRVSLYSGDMLIASYEVAIGREGWSTPTGQFTVFQKQINPAWQHPFTGAVVPPGPENPLGSRWIGFWSDGTNAIGFHGTPDESVIGTAVSHGCVRMRNADVVALYDQVTVDTPVTVVP